MDGILKRLEIRISRDIHETLKNIISTQQQQLKKATKKNLELQSDLEEMKTKLGESELSKKELQEALENLLGNDHNVIDAKQEKLDESMIIDGVNVIEIQQESQLIILPETDTESTSTTNSTLTLEIPNSKPSKSGQNETRNLTAQNTSVKTPRPRDTFSIKNITGKRHKVIRLSKYPHMFMCECGDQFESVNLLNQHVVIHMAAQLDPVPSSTPPKLPKQIIGQTGSNNLKSHFEPIRANQNQIISNGKMIRAQHGLDRSKYGQGHFCLCGKSYSTRLKLKEHVKYYSRQNVHNRIHNKKVGKPPPLPSREPLHQGSIKPVLIS